MIFTARLLDRVGKGIRGAPRDALLSELAPAEMRGACFGLRQALDTVGACLGPLIAILGIAYYHGAIRSTLYLAIPPAILSVVLLAFFVHEPEPEPKPESEPESKTEQLKSKPTLNFNFSSFMHLGKRFWQMLLIAMLMTLARFSDAFLLLKAHAIGFSLSAIPLVMLVMNAVYALSAYPAGFLSDRWSRKSVLLLGTALLIVADLFLALGTDNLTLFLGVILWGMHLGLTQGVLTAMVADSTSLSLRGSAYGLFYFTCGIMALIFQCARWSDLGALWSTLHLLPQRICCLRYMLRLVIFHTSRKKHEQIDASTENKERKERGKEGMDIFCP